MQCPVCSDYLPIAPTAAAQLNLTYNRQHCCKWCKLQHNPPAVNEECFNVDDRDKICTVRWGGQLRHGRLSGLAMHWRKPWDTTTVI